MKILYIPQRSDDKFDYSFEGEKIFFNGKLLLDFTPYQEDGELEEPPFPIITAKREDGVLFLALLKSYGIDATEDERFPKWKDVSEL